MDRILNFQPKYRLAIAEMDRAVLDSTRLAILRAYQESGVTSIPLDVGVLAGIRALAPPFDLRHITREVIRQLRAEGFDATWDDSSPSLYTIHVSWRRALRNARISTKGGRNQHSAHFAYDPRHPSLLERSPRYAEPGRMQELDVPFVRCQDSNEDIGFIPGLEYLVNPAKMNKRQIQ